MKLLIEKWNKFLLTEAMKTPEGLPENSYVWVREYDYGYRIEYVGMEIFGSISILKPKSTPFAGPCSQACIVEKTEKTLKGFGPMLYEIAIEIASKYHGGLTADREVVSSDALAVWQKYENRTDIKHDQLDTYIDGMAGEMASDWGFDEPQLTPNDRSDDCFQQAAHQESGEWTESALSKVYSKDNQEFIDKLINLKKIKFEKG